MTFWFLPKKFIDVTDQYDPFLEAEKEREGASLQ